MRNCGALAALSKLAKLNVSSLRSIDDDILRQLCALPSLVELTLEPDRTLRTTMLRLEKSNLIAITEARQSLGAKAQIFALKLYESFWETPQKLEIYRRFLWSFKVKLIAWEYGSYL